MRSLICTALTAFLLASPAVSQAPPPKLAATPPMGWNSWNWFAEKVTDKDVRQAADLLVSSGMRDAGYVYVNIDDGWQGKRDAAGILHPNEKFPDMKALSAYVHGKGLKLGIYSSPGLKTCGRFEGSEGHEQQDADLFASWGVDFLKYDLCSLHKEMGAAAPGDKAKQNKIMRDAYESMHQAILKAGRPMVYSLCQYGHDSSWDWAASVGAQMWRTTADIDATFFRMAQIGREQAGLERFAGPGHWNDPDMLEIGNGKFTLDEDRTHLSFWAMLASPLLAGNNLSELTPDVTAILTNREILAIDQDPLGKQASRIFAEGPVEIWLRPLAGGNYALAVFNFGEDETFLRGITLHLPPSKGRAWKARDVWAAKDLGVISDQPHFSLKRRSSMILRLSH